MGEGHPRKADQSRVNGLCARPAGRARHRSEAGRSRTQDRRGAWTHLAHLSGAAEQHAGRWSWEALLTAVGTQTSLRPDLRDNMVSRFLVALRIGMEPARAS